MGQKADHREQIDRTNVDETWGRRLTTERAAEEARQTR